MVYTGQIGQVPGIFREPGSGSHNALAGGAVSCDSDSPRSRTLSAILPKKAWEFRLWCGFTLPMQRLILPFALLLCPVTPAPAEETPADHAERMKAGTVLFRDSIRPVLIEHCVRCHGDEKVRSGLDLSSRELLLQGGDSGDSIDLVDPSNSFLLALIRHEEEPTMPPKNNKLGEALIADFERWIELGAPYDKPLLEKTADDSEMRITANDRNFWSFRPLDDPTPPETGRDWSRTDTDHFVLARLRENQLEPSPPAEDRDRIRRAYLAVIGLPPTPEEMDAALSISHEDLIDRLLGSPHYGERWARHWLDAARFAESHGFEQDYDRKYAYHYRDFVIKALNADMPWDQFVRWQIAGDEIAPDDPLAMMATGFLGAGVFPTQLTEKEFEIARYDELDDMASTIGTAMLGLTIGCARCHDHKFDPLPASDYYRFIATFTTTIRSEIDVDLDPETYRLDLAKWEARHEKLVAARRSHESAPEIDRAFHQWLEGDAPAAISTSEWTVLDVSEATSSQQATTLTVQDDGSILASGKAPAREMYTVKALTRAQPIRQVRIEALTHETLKRKGPGRAGNGNFALSNLRLFATPAGQEKRSLVRLIAARATHEQNSGNLSVASAIDDDTSGTGWAVDSGGIGTDQAAVFELAKPLEVPEGVTLEFQLTFTNNAQHSLGRFRLSVSGASTPAVVAHEGRSEKLDQALAALAGESLTGRHRETLFPHFAKADPTWVRLDEAVQNSLARKPQPSLAKVQVSSEGFPPTKHHADGRGFPHFYPETHFLNRGDPNQKEEVAETGYLQVLMRNGRTSEDWHRAPPPGWTRTSYRRSGMADWITDVENGAGHLLARVIVNRLWHHHFGRGIVATPNDFGLQGAEPTHPELLDFLARRLIANGWQLKPIHREILLSATWKQSSLPSQEKAEVDPQNQWLWRFPSRRLEAEVVRDAMLSASGQLDARMFGPGTLDEGHRRRSIYFMIKRSRLVPMMQIFDQPEPLTSQGDRPSTTIAPQALLFMNNPQVVGWARAMASEVEHEDSGDAVRAIYSRALGREPRPSELEESLGFLQDQVASYNGNEQPRELALADLCQVVFGLNEFIYLP